MTLTHNQKVERPYAMKMNFCPFEMTFLLMQSTITHHNTVLKPYRVRILNIWPHPILPSMEAEHLDFGIL